MEFPCGSLRVLLCDRLAFTTIQFTRYRDLLPQGPLWLHEGELIVRVQGQVYSGFCNAVKYFPVLCRGSVCYVMDTDLERTTFEVKL